MIEIEKLKELTEENLILSRALKPHDPLPESLESVFQGGEPPNIAETMRNAMRLAWNESILSTVRVLKAARGQG